MLTQSQRRLVAPLLVLAGAALFGIGAGGIAQVDARLEATVAPAPPTRTQPQPAPLAAEQFGESRGHRARRRGEL